MVKNYIFNMKGKVCLNCGKSLIGLKRRRKFCSEKCYDHYYYITYLKPKYYEKMKQRAIKTHINRRIKVLQKISSSKNPKCVNCGCNELEFLEINHKNSDGVKRGETGFKPKIKTYKFYNMILSGERKTDDLEILCRVCNSLHYLKSKYVSANFEVKWFG